MEFKKYSSIENSYRTKFINKIKESGYDSQTYIVQEKVHGANLSFWIDENSIKVAKRSGFIEEEEKFFNYKKVLSKYEKGLRDLHSNICGIFHRPIEDTTVVVYGELYGGHYPHKDVEASGDSSVQKGVFYNPEQDFIGFDIVVDGRLLSVQDVNGFLYNNGIPFCETLYSGTLDECLEHSNTFNTMIPVRLGLPELEDNTCEGTIIKPITPLFVYDGTRVIIKNKNEKFTEKEHKPKAPKPELPDNIKSLIDEGASYIIENRLRNVLSKIGVVTDKDFGKLMGLMNKDVIEDFRKDKSEELDALDKKDSKLIYKQLNSKVASLIRPNFANIVDGEF